jgi:chitinase
MTPTPTSRTRPLVVSALALLVLGVLLYAGAAPSGATFVASSTNPGNTFAAAADFNTVAVSLADPGAVVHGPVTLTATASSDRGIDHVTFQRAGADVCTDATAPYTCEIDTTAVADGPLDLRAVATDGAGYARSDTHTVTVDNTAPTTSLTAGATLTGSAALDGTASDAGSGLASVTVQYSPAGASTWTDVCAAQACAWDTTQVPDGLYDVRITATDEADNTASTVVAGRRVDNTAPTLTLIDPGAKAHDAVNLQAATTDAGSGVASVRYRYRPSGGSWQDACTATSAPFTCSWSTTTVADGTYDLQAIATDAAGNASTDGRAGIAVDNTAPSVSLPAPGAPLHGTVTLTGTATDAGGSGLATAAVQYRPAGGGTWTDACASAACTWNTSGLADGRYDLRITATDGAGNTSASAPITNVAMDNHAPAISSLPNPGPAGAAVTLSATTSDATGGTGVASVAYQYRPSGGGAWVAACTGSTTPFSCSWNTSGVAEGTYDVQATATDGAGWTTSRIVTGVAVDHTPPTAPAPTSPSGPVHGTVSFDPGVHDATTASVDYYGRQAGTTTWYFFTTISVAPFTLNGATQSVPDGVYELEAIAKDSAGNPSAAVKFPGTITIDNTAPTAADVQGTNGGVAGQLDAGDAIAFTYSEPIAPASLDAGWDGSAKPVTITFTDNGAADAVAVYDGATKVALTAALQLNADWVSATGSVAGTITRSGNTVTVTLGGAPAGARTGVSTAANMVWAPSTAATDLAGNAATATARTEQGTADVDF